MSQAVALSRSSRQRRSAIDLKWSLVIRIILVALLCVAGGVVFTLRNVATEATNQNREAATFVEQQLVTQLFRISTSLDRADRFPDWDTVANYALRPGQCVVLLLPDGTQKNSICAGSEQTATQVPRWFVRGFDLLFLDSSVAVKRLEARGQTRGFVKATTSSEAVAVHAWLELSRMLGLWVSMVAALCLLVYVVVHHALKPAADILVGISRLGDGDLTYRLPPFKLNELDRISEVFNELATKLQNTTRERAELARKLVDAQERERAHIARELHDDVAQRLTALSVAARSIRKLVGRSSPEAMRECDEFVELGSGTMRSLREALIHLRPPEIDELGLITSLRGLIDGQSRGAAGAPHIAFSCEGTFERMPPETAAHVYRIVQEALNNARRHANAKRVEVSLRKTAARTARHEAQIELRITDDGDGPGADWTLARSQPASVGLIGIRERIFALNGDFYAGAGPAGGFHLTASFPVTQRDNQEARKAA